jgi:hypothetical protein
MNPRLAIGLRESYKLNLDEIKNVRLFKVALSVT